MVFYVLFLVLSASSFLNSYDILDDTNTALESWGVSRVKRVIEKPEQILERFPDKTVLVCDMAWQTEETPFAAIILFRDSGRLLCMGTIVDAKHIVTAKRCYERCDARDLLVLVGFYKAYWGQWSQVRKVQKILRHEFEIAMLKLKAPIKFTDYVKPARFPPAGTKKSKFDETFQGPFQVVGFQVDRFDVPGDYISKEQAYKIKEDNVVKFDECKTNYTKLSLDQEKLFCVIGNATYCWGGWGAPVIKLMQPTKDPYWLLVGIVVADNCTTDTTGPLLAARADAYWDWIRGNSFQGHQPV